jgi:hypothetical protein
MKRMCFVMRLGTLALAGLLLAFAIGFSPKKANGEEYREKGWEIPNLAGRKPEVTKYDEDEGFKMEVFMATEKGNIAISSKNGEIYAYFFDGDMDGLSDYCIVDHDRDGKFETKYYRGEKWSIPEWAR